MIYRLWEGNKAILARVFVPKFVSLVDSNPMLSRPELDAGAGQGKGASTRTQVSVQNDF
jgi:hypothetical protein